MDVKKRTGKDGRLKIPENAKYKKMEREIIKFYSDLGLRSLPHNDVIDYYYYYSDSQQVETFSSSASILV